MSQLRHPDVRSEYAAFTNQGLQTHEVSQVAELLLAGASKEQLRHAIVEENRFQLRSEASRKTYFKTVTSRLEQAGDSLLRLLLDADFSTRRLTNLYLLLLQHRLLREFIAELVLDELAALRKHLDRSRLAQYMSEKRHNPVIADWSDATLQKSTSNLLRICKEAGLLDDQESQLHICLQFVPAALRRELQAANRQAYLKLLLDVEVVG